MGYVDIFRKLWGWLSGQTTVLVPPPKVIDRVNFVMAKDQVNLSHAVIDKVKLKVTTTDEIDF